MNTYLTVTRSIVSVIIGYLIFALTAFGLFQISGRPPHQAAPLWFMLGTVIYGCVFALIGGCVAMQASSAGAQYSGRDRFGARCRSLVAEHAGQGGGMVASCRFSVDGTECSLRRLAASQEGHNCVTLLWA
jgi:hypothetical protein